MKRAFEWVEALFAAIVVAAGFYLRWRLASTTYLNPDEAMHALLSLGLPENTWRQAFANSFAVTHPPLFIMLMHAVSKISRTEIALRAIPVFSGSLFPFVLFFWLRSIAGRVAAMGALLILTFSPHLISLSAQLRAYTLALLLIALSLAAFERGIRNGRWALFNVLLILCVLADYSTAWFLGALGVYALVRMRQLKIGWIAGQAMVLGIYAVLYFVHIRPARDAHRADATSGWLLAGFPHGNWLTFPLANTVKQFAYLMDSVPLGAVATIIFVIAVILVWTGRTKFDRSFALFLTVPFVLGMAGAYLHMFPFGRTRHTILLGTIGAIGIAIFLEWLPRKAGLALVWMGLAATPLWVRYSPPDVQDIFVERWQKQQMLDCVAYLKRVIPNNATIFTDHQTALMLAYYTGANEVPKARSESILDGRWHEFAWKFKFNDREQFETEFAQFRGLHRGPVWVVSGGWDPVIVEDPALPFSKAVGVALR